MPISDAYLPLDSLLPDPANYNLHSPGNVAVLCAQILEVGFTAPFLADEKTKILAAGHRRRLALLKLREDNHAEPDGVKPGWLVPCRLGEWSEIQRLKVLIGDNTDPQATDFDTQGLAALLASLANQDELEGSGYDAARLDELIAEAGGLEIAAATEAGDGASAAPAEARKSLADRFGVPPFSVLDARQGYWQDRKRAWLALGIQSELGRGENLQDLSQSNDAYRYDKTEYLARIGRGPLASNNGLLGEAEQARTHYRSAEPGGGKRPACRLGEDGKTVRGDGRGRGLARCFGQDLIKGENPNFPARQREATPYGAIGAADDTSRRIAAATPRTAAIRDHEWQRDVLGHVQAPEAASGTSIFDPVLCELAYRWFSPEGGAILDPFAGGSVRGIVASCLGRSYTGVDLSARQLEANAEQARAILKESHRPPRWIAGDSTQIDQLVPCGSEYDFVFSCPPYADLERYSDDPRDLSAMSYADFLAAYRRIIAAAVGMLKADRFACFCVGDIRDGRGFYRNFVSDTIAAFQDAGATLYNEAILVTAVGSLPIRVGKQFGSYRKLGKTHQNVLVFLKGDPKRIPEVLTGACEFGNLGEPEEATTPEAAPPGVQPAGTVTVKVSAAMARQQFHGCEPEYIRTVCHGACCESKSAPGGTLITIHPTERAAVEARGGVIRNGMLQPVAGRCPFKTTVNLCGLHGEPEKPFGCIASPFTLNPSGTLVVRNRYRLLKCYRDGDLPAYRAFRASLDLIFGPVEADRVCRHLDGGGGDIQAQMPTAAFQMLRDNDHAKASHASR